MKLILMGFFTIHWNLGQFTLILREADYKKRKLSQVTINCIQNVKIRLIPYNLIDKMMSNII
jgi:hypothetical protein